MSDASYESIQLDKILNSAEDALSGEYVSGEEQQLVVPIMEIPEIKSTLRDAVTSGELVLTDDVSDYLKTRDTLHKLLEKVTTGVEGSLAVALETQQARPFEVFKQLVDTSNDITKSLMALQKVYREIQKMKMDTGEGSGTKTDGNDNPGISLTTADLSRFMTKAEDDDEA